MICQILNKENGFEGQAIERTPGQQIFMKLRARCMMCDLSGWTSARPATVTSRWALGQVHSSYVHTPTKPTCCPCLHNMFQLLPHAQKRVLSSVTNLKTSKPIFCSKWTVFGSYIRMSTHFNNFQSPYMSALNIKGRAVLSNEMKILALNRNTLVPDPNGKKSLYH